MKSLIFRTVVFVFCFRVICMYATGYLDDTLAKKKKTFPVCCLSLGPVVGYILGFQC